MVGRPLLSAALFAAVFGCARSAPQPHPEDATGLADDAPAEDVTGPDATAPDVADPAEPLTCRSLADGGCEVCATAAVAEAFPAGGECDALAAFCPLGGPVGGAEVGGPLPPSPGCCPLEPQVFAEYQGIPGEPTLDVDVGQLDQSGAFVPLEAGGWVPQIMGPQGMFHVWASVRLWLPGETADLVHVRIAARALDGCAVAGTTTLEVDLRPDPNAPGAYTFLDVEDPGFVVLFPFGPVHACVFCGHWVDLRIQVRPLPGTAWGETQRTQRLYLPALPDLGPGGPG